jgi:hypothetical protein
MCAKRRLDQFRRPRRDLGDAPGLVAGEQSGAAHRPGFSK